MSNCRDGAWAVLVSDAWPWCLCQEQEGFSYDGMAGQSVRVGNDADLSFVAILCQMLAHYLEE